MKTRSNTKITDRRFWWLVALVVTLVYFILHLSYLTKLPVFADEAIYIRWAQLIMDDAGRWLFYALNDGKTPLFVWSLVPFQYLFNDQLFAARLVSVIVGWVQLLVIGVLTWKLVKSKAGVVFSLVLTTFLPFWFFHHRMALMDGMLTLWLSLALLGVVVYLEKVAPTLNRLTSLRLTDLKELVSFKLVVLLALVGFFLGAAFWTKLPAVLFIPSLFIWPLAFLSLDLKHWRQLIMRLLISWIFLLVSVLFGLFLFYLLKLHPAFGQLFGRGGDFLFTTSELLHGEIAYGLKKMPSYFQALSYYLTPFALLAPLIGLILKKHRKLQFVLLLSTASFLLPMMLYGRVVYPRYFLPAAIFLTLSYAVLLSDLVELANLAKKLTQKALLALVVALMLANTAGPTLAFILPSFTHTKEIPFVKVDQVQYLSAWSAGDGVKEVTEKLLTEKSAQNRIALATEGYFGTLPDGILMYLHGKDVNYLMVEGIGQPVGKIPPEFKEKAKAYDQVWLLVNSNRLEMDLPKDKLIASYCRLPDPKTKEKKCLLLIDITDLVKSDSGDNQTF